MAGSSCNCLPACACVIEPGATEEEFLKSPPVVQPLNQLLPSRTLTSTFMISLMLFLPSHPTGSDCERVCMFENRNCRDRWHEITPAGSERHSDIAFFLSSQPSPHTLHPHQIFFYSGLRGCEEGGCAESWPALNADILLSTLLQFLILPHVCACTHTCTAHTIRPLFYFILFYFFHIHLGANHSAHFLCRFNHHLFEP